MEIQHYSKFIQRWSIKSEKSANLETNYIKTTRQSETQYIYSPQSNFNIYFFTMSRNILSCSTCLITFHYSIKIFSSKLCIRTVWNQDIAMTCVYLNVDSMQIPLCFYHNRSANTGI